MHALQALVAVVDLQLPSPEIQNASKQLRYFSADVSNPEEVEKATEGILGWSQEAQLDIAGVVNCAGFLGSSKVRKVPMKSYSMCPLTFREDLVQEWVGHGP